MESLYAQFIEYLGKPEGDSVFEQIIEGLGQPYSELDICDRKTWFFEYGAHMAFSFVDKPYREYSDVIFCGRSGMVSGQSYSAFSEPLCAGILITDSRDIVQRKLEPKPKELHGITFVSKGSDQIYDYYDLDGYELEFKFSQPPEHIQGLIVRRLDPTSTEPLFY